MHLQRLELTDVRSYRQAALDLGPGVTLLVGPNAQGKTNLLEAVHRAATGSSHRVASDGPLVRLGAERAVIRCRLRTDAGRQRRLELELLAAGQRGRARARVDGQDVRRAADALGVVRVVLFAPEDVTIVRGDPADRRRFLDDLLAQRRPAYAAARADYDRALRQRNQLLKQTRGASLAASAASTLEIWTEQLVAFGAQLVAARIAAARTLAGPTDAGYRRLADRPEAVTLAYRSSAFDHPVTGDPEVEVVPDPAPIAAALRARLAARAEEERRRGVSLVGPHRDDLELSIGRLPARGYASHGEVWSLALALKLATEVLLSEVGDRPIVLLDDVFAELDETRRRRLAEACDGFEQVLVTAAVEADVPLVGSRVDVRLHEGVSSLVARATTAGSGAEETGS